ncbi:heme-binding protein [Adhaeribacter aerolatus]|uniref:Heme-binding protein n=1 Tax=Adhaeribacter aerolatus TaxID=670289 RepID=A0A512B570_9BACT|nr:heme-binding domain-containing protein [Adhaeribacter aerolatus]GEO07122.1 heme-binding protein [Adhaeribacter aerolatus]
MLKKSILGLSIVFLIIQFFRPEKNISIQGQSLALKKQYVIPENVELTFQKACYDCHSNNTRYPWYAEVQPVAWFLADHVNDGKEELNFDEFLTYPLKKQDHKLEEVIETQEEDSMPLSSYTLIHRDAVLTRVQKEEIISWANLTRRQIQLKRNQ